MIVAVEGVLMIAILFFLVTMGLAVGPLLLCRLFAGPREQRRSDSGVSTLLQGFLGLCGLAIVVGFGVMATYFSLRASTQENPTQAPGPVVDVAPTGGTEHSLFDHPVQPPAQTTSVVSERPTLVWAILLPVLLVTSLLTLGSQWFRQSLARSLPVVLACVLVLALVLQTAPSQHAEGLQQQAIVQKHQHQTLEASSAVHALARPEIPVNVDTAQPEAAHVGQPTTTEWSNEAGASSEEAPPVTTYIGTAAAGVPRSDLPFWAMQEDDGPIRVIDSGMHATVQLAEEDALAELTSLLQAELVRQHPQAAGWQPSQDILLHADNILQRAVERSQIQVGDYTSPMYAAYWQVDTTDIAPLYEAWRPTIVNHRLVWLGAGIGVLTLLLGSLAGVLRVDEQTAGQRRKSLAAGTLTLWALVGGIAIFVFRGMGTLP